MIQPETKSKQTHWMNWLLVGAPLVLIGGCLTTLIAVKKSAQSQLYAKLAELEAKGYPINDGGLAEFHEQSCSSENQSTWVQILDTLGSPSFSAQVDALPILGKGPAIPSPGQAWSEQVEVESLLAQHSRMLEQLLAISQDNGAVQFPIKFSGVNTLLPYTQNMRTAVRLLQLEAAVAMRHGDVQREFRAINAMIGCSMALSGEPFWVSQLVVIAANQQAKLQLMSGIVDNRLSNEQLSTLQKRLEALRDLQPMYDRAIKGEAAMVTTALRDLSEFPDISPVMAKLLTYSGMGDRASLSLLNFFERAAEVSTSNLQDFQTNTLRLEQEMQSGPSWRMNIENLFRPSYQALSNAMIRHRMSTDLAVIAIAIRRFEKQNGKLPSSLTQLSDFGLSIEELKMVDGNIPRYQLLNESSGTADHLPVNETKSVSAVLWGFDPSPGSKYPTLSETPPSNIPDVDSGQPALWVWEFK